MTLKEFKENLDEFIAENPEALDLLVITARDDEGNGFNPVHYTPSMGRYEDREFEQDSLNANAVCLN